MDPIARIYFDRTRFATLEEVWTNLARYLGLDALDCDLTRFGVSLADCLGLPTGAPSGKTGRPVWLRGVIKGGR